MRYDTRHQSRAARAAAHAMVLLACASPAGGQPVAPASPPVGDARATSMVRDSSVGALDVRCPRAPLSDACSAPVPPAMYTGTDALGVPRYIGGVFTAEERRLLRVHFGVEHPERLYISDYGFLTYDTEHDRGTANVVVSHRVGGLSARRPGESWEEFERRVRRTPAAEFGPDARRVETSLDALDPRVREDFERMITDARRAGFDVRVAETRRSPERQAYLLGRGDGSTYTGTSFHSDGHAADLIIGDGKLGRPATRARWIAFRRWVRLYDRGQFQLIGTPEESWDWPHVAIAGEQPGFRTIEEALEAAGAAAGGVRLLARGSR